MSRAALWHDSRVWISFVWCLMAWAWVLERWLGRERLVAIREKLRQNSLARGLFFSLYAIAIMHDLPWPWTLALVFGIVACTWFVDARIGQEKPQATCALVALVVFAACFCGMSANGTSPGHAIAWAMLGSVIAGIVTMFNVPPLSRAVPIVHPKRE